MSKLLGVGNPLLDVTAEVDTKFLDKYSIKVPSYQFEGEAHAGYYDELEKKNNVQILPGGCTLNSVRIAQALYKQNDAVFYIGSSGSDNYADKLQELCVKESVTPVIYRHPTALTGICGVSIVDKERALCTRIGAAREFPDGFIQQPDVWKVVEAVDHVYSAGFFLDSNAEAQIEVAKECSRRGATFSTNLSAEFVVEVYKDAMMKIFPHANLVFGNETEWAKFGEVHGLGCDLKEVLKKAAAFPLADEREGRTVIMTQGSSNTVVATFRKANQDCELFEVAVKPVPAEEIVDCNAAGDAFVGGFLFGLLTKLSTEKCVEIGHFTAGHVIRKSGCSFDFEKETIP